MNGKVPTRIGDVLILTTAGGGSMYALGGIPGDAQQDLRNSGSLKYVTGRQTAETEAKLLVMPGRQIFLRDIHTGEWEETSQLTSSVCSKGNES
jgi:hypothetical protein